MEEPPHPGAAAAGAAAAGGGGAVGAGTGAGGGAGAGDEGFLDAGEVPYTPYRPVKAQVSEWLCTCWVSLPCVRFDVVNSSPILSG